MFVGFAPFAKGIWIESRRRFSQLSRFPWLPTPSVTALRGIGRPPFANYAWNMRHMTSGARAVILSLTMAVLCP